MGSVTCVTRSRRLPAQMQAARDMCECQQTSATMLVAANASPERAGLGCYTKQDRSYIAQGIRDRSGNEHKVSAIAAGKPGPTAPRAAASFFA